MTKLTRSTKIALIVAAFAITLLTAGVATGHLSVSHAVNLGSVLMFGTAVVTYQYPVSGSTAPTLAQMNGNAPHNIVTGTISFADADTTAAITHSFGNLATGQGEGSTESTKLFPVPNLWAQTLGTATGTVVPQFSFQYTSSVVLTVTKGGTGNGTGGTYVFQLLRPGSPQR